jgi:hypothetical protein
MRDQLADVSFHLGQIHCRLGAAGDRAQYLRALEYFTDSMQTHTRETHPLDWAAATLNMAEIHETLAQESSDNEELLAAAEQEYDAVVQCLLSDERLRDGILERIESGQSDPAIAFLNIGWIAPASPSRASLPDLTSARRAARCCSYVP